MKPQQPVGSDPRLVTMANHADASNRPTVIVAGVSVLVLASIIYAFVGVFSMRSASEQLDRERATAVNTRSVAGQILAARVGKQDPGSYGSAALMPNYVDRVRDAVFTDLEPGQQIDRVVVYPRSPTTEALQSARGVDRATLEVRVNNQPLGTILRFVDEVLGHPQLATTFVSTLELSPQAQGWNARVVFKRYAESRN